MRFQETKLRGAFVVELEKHEDERGFFARSWCEQEFAAHKLNSRTVQCNVSFNKTKGTLRGMHYQIAPCAEAKLVRCTRGSIFDVIIDLRPDSPTYTKYVSEVLSADNYKAFYVPEGFAHGFQTLEDNSEVFYQMTELYSPQHQRGLRYNDPMFSINWPIDTTVISERDRSYPDFRN
ncbi:MAG TPA: dTDP-4-dehydrorhamnose 3,5-epimerase [Terriglobales bacterium]|nr:dTDP-4-dehydrorhamnose 3,5-epimerase [Terriglobales bacterium]